jgi:hypothetical protein
MISRVGYFSALFCRLTQIFQFHHLVNRKDVSPLFCVIYIKGGRNMNLEQPQLLAVWLQQANQQVFELTPIAEALDFTFTAAFSLPIAPPETPRYFALVSTGITKEAARFQLTTSLGHSTPQPETGIITLDTNLHVDLNRDYHWLELALIYSLEPLDQEHLLPAFFTTSIGIKEVKQNG